MLGEASAGGLVGGPGLVLHQMNRSRSVPETLSAEILRPAASAREGEELVAGVHPHPH